MPELPEVETVRRGLEQRILGQEICAIVVRESKLRWRIPDDLAKFLEGRTIDSVMRRGKYLLVRFGEDSLLIHLGMSGKLLVVSQDQSPSKHDHVDVTLKGGLLLRFHDPRRFGCLLPIRGAASLHPLLARLGPEPFDADFSDSYLYALSRRRRISVKPFLMDGRVVAGVGNIYASEALYEAGLHPATKVGRINRAGYGRLVEAIRTTLSRATDLGGSTLRDFGGVCGEAGYFQQIHKVYGRAGQPCYRCGARIQQQRIAQRSSFFCSVCQPGGYRSTRARNRDSGN